MMTIADLVEAKGIEEHRVTIKLTAEEVAFVKWMKKEHFYEGKDEHITFNQTLARMLALQLREDMDTYGEEVGI